MQIVFLHGKFYLCTFSYIESRYVPYLETYRVSKWGIFYETKLRWNEKKEVIQKYQTNAIETLKTSRRDQQLKVLLVLYRLSHGKGLLSAIQDDGER